MEFYATCKFTKVCLFAIDCSFETYLQKLYGGNQNCKFHYPAFTLRLLLTTISPHSHSHLLWYIWGKMDKRGTEVQMGIPCLNLIGSHIKN